MLEVWAIMSVMPGLSTIVAQTGWKVYGLGNLLLAFLDETKLLLLFLSYHHGLREHFTNRELSGLAGVTSWFALTRTSLLTGNFPLTYIYFR
jgi:hypothetical protein